MVQIRKGGEALSFYKKYILLNLSDYDSFRDFDFYITVFLWILTAALCVGIFIMNNRKNSMVRVVKQLLRHGARTEEGAKALPELGIKASAVTKRLLSDGARMSRFVKRVGAKELTYEEYLEGLKRKKKRKKKPSAESEKETPGEKGELSKNAAVDFATARFYIPESSDNAAKRVLGKRESTLWQSALASVLCISLSVCLTFLLPVILELIDTLLA